jgi:ATP-binding cassette subfamily C (CFTR/MRP) protein 10
LLEKLFVFGLPSFAACLSLLGLAVLVKKKVGGIDVPNHELLFRCSQFLAWVRSPLQ